MTGGREQARHVQGQSYSRNNRHTANTASRAGGISLTRWGWSADVRDA